MLDDDGALWGGWLFSIVEEMAGPIEMDTTFEDAGGNTSVPLQFVDRFMTE